VRVEEKKDINDVPEIHKVVQDVEAKHGDNGRVLIRYSGTEPLLRIMLEGQDQKQINDMADAIAKSVERHLGGHRENK